MPVYENNPDEVLGNEPVHDYFSLSYASYLVLPRSVMQAMPTEWQERMVQCLKDISHHFHGTLDQVDYEVVSYIEGSRDESHSDDEDDDEESGIKTIDPLSHYRHSQLKPNVPFLKREPKPQALTPIHPSRAANRGVRKAMPKFECTVTVFTDTTTTSEIVADDEVSAAKGFKLLHGIYPNKVGETELAGGCQKCKRVVLASEHYAINEDDDSIITCPECFVPTYS